MPFPGRFIALSFTGPRRPPRQLHPSPLDPVSKPGGRGRRSIFIPRIASKQTWGCQLSAHHPPTTDVGRGSKAGVTTNGRMAPPTVSRTLTQIVQPEIEHSYHIAPAKEVRMGH